MSHPEEKTTPKEKRTTRLKGRLARNFPFFRYGSRKGMVAGLLMGAYLLILQVGVAEPSSLLRFLKYLILAAVLGFSIYQYREHLPKGKVFRNGILLGLYITFVSALTLVAFNGLVYAVNADWAIDKFSLEPGSLGEFLVIDGVLFFEILVYGLILTFIWLQYFKSQVQQN